MGFRFGAYPHHSRIKQPGCPSTWGRCSGYLWPTRCILAQGQPRSRPQAARRRAAARRRRAGGTGRHAAAMPMLRRPHGHHRDLRALGSAAGATITPITEPGVPAMTRHGQRPSQPRASLHRATVPLAHSAPSDTPHARPTHRPCQSGYQKARYTMPSTATPARCAINRPSRSTGPTTKTP